MIASYKRKSNIAALVSLAAVVVATWWSGDYPGSNVDRGGGLLALGLAFALYGIAAGAFGYALLALMRAKGREPKWMTSLLLGPMVAIFLLKDHAKDGQPPKPDPTKHGAWSSDAVKTQADTIPSNRLPNYVAIPLGCVFGVLTFVSIRFPLAMLLFGWLTYICFKGRTASRTWPDGSPK